MSADDVSLDGWTLHVVASDGGEVGSDTVFEFEQDGERISARYAGGAVVEGYLVGTLVDGTWDVRYVQMTGDGETGHSVGEVTVLDAGRVRVEDEWEWESKPGTGTSVHEEVR